MGPEHPKKENTENFLVLNAGPYTAFCVNTTAIPSLTIIF